MSSRKKPSQLAAVLLTQRALDDIRSIESYSLEQWGRKTTEKYLDDLASALDRLKLNSEILRIEPDFAADLYFYRVRKHVLVCDYDRRTVIVLTVIHASMDIPARLVELQPQLIAEAQFLRDRLRSRANK